MNLLKSPGRLFHGCPGPSGWFSWERLSNSIKSGKFLRVAAGVYRLMQFPRHPHEDLFYSWLSTGPHSAISHESALAYYELTDVLPPEIHVIVPRMASRRRKNICLHINRIEPDEVTMHGGLRVTTVARTIAEVAAVWLMSSCDRQSRRLCVVGWYPRKNCLPRPKDGVGGPK